jgi:hypothetical protein
LCDASFRSGDGLKAEEEEVVEDEDKDEKVEDVEDVELLASSAPDGAAMRLAPPGDAVSICD